MIRRTFATVAISLLAVGGIVGPAGAQTTATTAKHPLKCVGAVEQKAALGYRVQALNSHIAALNARKAAAQSAGRADLVARIDARLAEAQARLAKVTAHQTALNTRCP